MRPVLKSNHVNFTEPNTGSQMEFIKEIATKLKPLNTADDLVNLGIANSTKTLANKRFCGTGPDYIRISGAGIRYPAEAIIRWLDNTCVYVVAQKKKPGQ